MAEDTRKDPESSRTMESMPAQPKTAQLPQVPPWAIELMKATKDGFRATDEHFDKQDKVLARLADESVSTVQRVGRMESTLNDYGSRIITIESRQDNTSLRVKGVSVSDDGQNMQIASLAVKVDELGAEHAKLAKETTAQTAMLSTITGLLDKPLVRRLGYAVAGLMLAGLTSATGYLARGNVAAPQPTIIQVAPVAILDGGTQ